MMESFENAQKVLNQTEQELYEKALAQDPNLTVEKFLELREAAKNRPTSPEGMFEGNGVIMQGEAPSAEDIHDQYE